MFAAMPYDVFISYSGKDKATADRVYQFLEKQGIACWIAPRDVPPGETYGAAIIRAIEDSLATVILFSEHSNTSEHVKNEIERTVHKRPRGKVLMDALQNARGKPLATVYSARAYPSAPVSTPVTPAELKTEFAADRWSNRKADSVGGAGWKTATQPAEPLG